MPIGASSPVSSTLSSGPTSHPGTPARSRSPSNAASGLGHARGRSFAVRRPLSRIIELILDLCDTAMEVSMPSIRETKVDGDEFRTQSPNSENRMLQIYQWQQPSSLDNEVGLVQLSVDTERMAKAKVDAVHRHRVIIEYAERIRQEYMAEVDACIAEALSKAERMHNGESFSSESEDEMLKLPEIAEEEPTPLALEPASTTSLSSSPEPLPAAIQSPTALPQLDSSPYVGRSMASVMSSEPSEIALTVAVKDRRSSSAAISTRSNSPMECPTPRSHHSGLIQQPQPLAKRRSMYVESDANDSDASLPSSVPSQGAWRTDSPASEAGGLSRAASSRDRKRRSLHLHGLGSGSPRRQHSPGRYPQPPPSPLRMTKPRLPSGESTQSPIVSPLLQTGEFMPNNSHHRRQSSVHSSDHPPTSPRLASVQPPQARVLPPSIKDFEIIKPISKGAFGSVYLSKKKLTGEYFAIKVLRKSDMIAKNQVTNVKAERAIMMWQGESDFVAKLYWTFSSRDYLFLVMEYLNGGDCASLVKILGGLPEDWSKKYIAEVILGVEHLHSRGIVHRDLKPDNLLIDSKGHLKLTDFGLSRMGLVGRQKRVQRTPDESAPDLLKADPFSKPVSTTSSRSASFDFHGSQSPDSTPLMTPSLAGGLDAPSYFSLNREPSLSRGSSRKISGHQTESGRGSNRDLRSAFRSFSIHDLDQQPMPPIPRSSGLIEEESFSQGSASTRPVSIASICKQYLTGSTAPIK